MIRSSALLLALAAASVGCGSNPVIGTWTSTRVSSNVTATDEITFDDGGSVTEASTSSGCTGTETFDGLSWTSTSTVLTLTGTVFCQGMYVCMDMGQTVPLDCGDAAGMTTMSTLTAGTCQYSLSDEKDTLDLACTFASASATPMALSLTRQQ
jgi:hypothetical protein